MATDRGRPAAPSFPPRSLAAHIAAAVIAPAIEAISQALQAQYERWQPRARYKVAMDPTADVRSRMGVRPCRRQRHPGPATPALQTALTAGMRARARALSAT